jgi:hypothetical protein
MKYAVETGSDTMIYIHTYIPSFIKTGSGIQKLMGEIHRHAESMVISEPTFILFEVWKVG